MNLPDWLGLNGGTFKFLFEGQESRVHFCDLSDAAGGSVNDLGLEVEVRVQWKITNNLELEASYDHWFTASYFDRLPTGA